MKGYVDKDDRVFFWFFQRKNTSVIRRGGEWFSIGNGRL